MKNYTITVNGKVYDVTVEEKDASAAMAASASYVSMPAPVPRAPQAAAPSAAGGEGTPIEAGAAGKVFRVEAPVGTKVQRGQTIVVLEVMKMETPVVAPKDGTILSVAVSEGQSVEAGDLLATLGE